MAGNNENIQSVVEMIAAEESEDEWTEVDFLGGVAETQNYVGQLIPRQPVDLASSPSARRFFNENDIVLLEADIAAKKSKPTTAEKIDIRSFGKKINGGTMIRQQQKQENVGQTPFKMPETDNKKQGRLNINERIEEFGQQFI